MDLFSFQSGERQRLRRHWMISRHSCRSVCDNILEYFSIENLGCPLQLCKRVLIAFALLKGAPNRGRGSTLLVLPRWRGTHVLDGSHLRYCLLQPRPIFHSPSCPFRIDIHCCFGRPQWVATESTMELRRSFTTASQRGAIARG
jgi:hypothetical protein